jgi:hypothetical protein
MVQTEWVRYKRRGQVLAIEGLGRRMPTTGAGDTLFNAWAVIEWSLTAGMEMRPKKTNVQSPGP